MLGLARVLMAVGIAGGLNVMTAVDTSAQSTADCRWRVDSLDVYVGPPSPGLDADEYSSSVWAAFRAWSQLAGLGINEVASADSADIAVVWVDDPEHAWFPPGGTAAWAERPPGCSVTEMGTTKPLAFTQNRNQFGTTEQFQWSLSGDSRAYDLKTVVLHEVGHSLGLGHCRDRRRRDIECPESAVMNRFIGVGKVNRELTRSDTLRIRARYAIR